MDRCLKPGNMNHAESTPEGTVVSDPRSGDGTPRHQGRVTDLGPTPRVRTRRSGVIDPGIIDTSLLAGVDDQMRTALAANVPFPKRLGEPEDFAKLVLAIIDNGYLNGETIRMDGALRMAPR
jgi:hypothetical protein